MTDIDPHKTHMRTPVSYVVTMLVAAAAGWGYMEHRFTILEANQTHADGRLIELKVLLDRIQPDDLVEKSVAILIGRKQVFDCHPFASRGNRLKCSPVKESP